jgi:APA family basic amino acid/polyamine antiporter
VIVNLGVIVLRRTRPDMQRGFRVPLVPLFPIIGILLCFGLMATLPATTWVRFGIWLLLGVVIYFVYGRRNSLLQQGRPANPEAEMPAQ